MKKTQYDNIIVSIHIVKIMMLLCSSIDCNVLLVSNLIIQDCGRMVKEYILIFLMRDFVYMSFENKTNFN